MTIDQHVFLSKIKNGGIFFKDVALFFFLKTWLYA